ncbi:photosynthetic NDH subunit of subcomplex B 3, chloroplastic [Cocos nucifera]|uniref:Photosynthetic NDH subunit of subcomplex B 3, chloroplastic n=1 Tax=Cocos nucifera TaxID=13894 RepID=A0A8K0IAB3_COCNU|nr:photosynthetic NDH subunit of subcomplex B 3, chloroplastic [Cocos nucifera]
MATATFFVSPALHPEAFPFSSLPPSSGSGTSSYRSRRNLFFSPSRSKHFISISRLASNPSPWTPEKPPEIELEFVGGTSFVWCWQPKAGADGSYPVDRASAISGQKLLRNIMVDNKIELYATYGKVMNCGGGGSCGTCIVEIVDGMELLNEKTNTEKRYLKKKPESWRLACQTIVGNKENAGKVVVQRMPQRKK